MNILPLLLSGGVLIGILSNIIYPKNFWVSCLVLIGCVLVWAFWRPFKLLTKRLTYRQITLITSAGLALIFLFQLLELHFFPATIYHDPFRVIYQAELLSRGHYDWGRTVYFWRFPNNVPITYMLAEWLKVTNVFHLTTNTAIHLMSIGFLDGFIAICLRTIHRFSKRNDLVLGTLLFFLCSPFAYTYYLQVLYSDLPILFCLAVSFNIIARWQQYQRWEKWLAGPTLFLTIVLGQLIKPNLIVLAIATVLIIVALLIKSRQRLVKYGLPLAIVLLGFAAFVPAQAGVLNAARFTNNPKYEVPTTHWIWMSYNPQGTGKYMFNDVQTEAKLPNKAARQAFLKKALPARLKQLGPVGVVKRWLQKAAILLNVGGIQQAYTGGFRQAPSWYLNHQHRIHFLSEVLMRVYFVTFDSYILMKCIALMKRKQSLTVPVMDLAILTALGYLAFHTLLWETESRYGQAIYPLLLMIMALPTPVLQYPAWVKQPNSRQTLTWGAAITASVVMVLSVIPLTSHKRVIVAAQRSQLSLQFDAKPTAIKAGSEVYQTITANHAINDFTVQKVPHSLVQASLVNQKTHQKIALVSGNDNYYTKRALPAGQYQIRLQNNTDKAQLVSLVKMQRYRLAPAPLKIGNKSYPYSSLIYTVAVRPTLNQ